MTDFSCPSDIRCCTNFVRLCIERSGGLKDVFHDDDNMCIIGLKDKYLKQQVFYNGHLDKEVTILPEGSVHLKFFDKRNREIYYRSSCGIQIITVDDHIVSKLNYLDDCVLCKNNVIEIFNVAYNIAGV